jgi:hypothetical protein
MKNNPELATVMCSLVLGLIWLVAGLVLESIKWRKGQ